MQRRAGDNMSKFFAPLFAAVLGSSPATYVSVEMYTTVSERAIVNKTELLASARWQARQEINIDNINKLQKELEKEITIIKVQIANLK